MHQEEDQENVRSIPVQCVLVEILTMLGPNNGTDSAVSQDVKRIPASLPFEFVSCTAPAGRISQASHRKIRSHVMHRHKLKQQESDNQSGSITRTRPNPHPKQLAGALAMIPHELSAFDPFDCLPFRMEPWALDVLTTGKQR